MMCFSVVIIITCFSKQLLLVVFFWRMSDSKYSQIGKTLLRILADLNDVWIVPTLQLISNPSFRSPGSCDRNEYTK